MKPTKGRYFTCIRLSRETKGMHKETLLRWVIMPLFFHQKHLTNSFGEKYFPRNKGRERWEAKTWRAQGGGKKWEM